MMTASVIQRYHQLGVESMEHDDDNDNILLMQVYKEPEKKKNPWMNSKCVEFPVLQCRFLIVFRI